ncbi:MAG: DUF5721 family protein [Defluviitaleaceae bacterium]|nr:DUF5721 family protein [Defluviitaleaceae bacterium]MCL2263221.1 DUF5721 family protein [Defluviitaleaceae bacterium]
MLALEMEKSDVKGFMGRLLREELFDKFEARLVEVATTTKITIDGLRITEPTEENAAEPPAFATWGEMRPLVYEIIKFSAKPRQVKIIFAGDTEIHTNAAALFLNLLYENDTVTFTTATAQKQFAMDKTLDNAWDDSTRKFFSDAGITVSDRE